MSERIVSMQRQHQNFTFRKRPNVKQVELYTPAYRCVTRTRDTAAIDLLVT